MYNYQITIVLGSVCYAVIFVRLFPLQMLKTGFFFEPFFIFLEALLLGIGLAKDAGTCSKRAHRSVMSAVKGEARIRVWCMERVTCCMG